jgi:HD superfamily phosphodiesterase
MKRIYVDSIAKAKSYYKGFDDPFHNLSHSQRVAENAAKIAKSLGYKDLDFLTVCVYWHDIARTQNIDPHEEPGAAMARDDLLVRGVSAKTANLAYEAIRFHKSTANPLTVEGKIVRDADKLDLISVARWENYIKAGKFADYATERKETMENINRYPGAFTYDYTKKLYAERFPKFWEYYESIKDQLPAA